MITITWWVIEDGEPIAATDYDAAEAADADADADADAAAS
jgi:hypothetical protein